MQVSRNTSQKQAAGVVQSGKQDPNLGDPKPSLMEVFKKLESIVVVQQPLLEDQRMNRTHSCISLPHPEMTGGGKRTTL